MGRRQAGTKSAVAALHAEGLSGAEIARRLGLARSTVAYHLRTLGKPVDDRCNRRYDWDAVQQFYDAGHSISECQAEFGMARKAFFDAVQRGDLTTRPQGMPIEELVVGRRNRSHLKRRLIRAGLLAPACALCGLHEWRGAPLSLQLHHVNGKGQDNRLENLQLLCPNCHSQTENWGGRNRASRPDDGTAA